MKLSFENWVISKDTGLLGYQYDNESQELWVTGDLPQGWTWDALIQDGSHYDVWPLTLADRGAYITLNDENLAVPGSFYIQIRGTKGEQVQHTNIVSVYISRSLVGPGTWPTLPTEFSQAEQNIQELNAHPPTPGENGYWMLWNLETSSYQESQIPIPGLQINIGTTTTGEPGTQASVTNSGTPTDPVLNFVIPAGKDGKDGQDGSPGPAPTLSAGEVTTLPPGDPATVTVSGQDGSYQIGFGIPQGQPGADGAQINDAVISTTETWSSSNIVNMLCPPFTVTGNPVTCNPVANYPLDVTVNFTPKQAGTGDPSPENTRPISGWDGLQVARCGKNLLGIPKIDQSTPGGVSGVSVSVNLPVPVTISADYSAAIISKSIWRFKVDFLDGSSSYGLDDGLNGTTGTHTTFNGTQENPITSITYRGTNIESGEIASIMCNVGTTPTPYEPYQGDTYGIALPETVYGGTVDVVTGKGEKTWVEYQADGTENVGIGSTDEFTIRWYFSPQTPTLGNLAQTAIMCNVFKTLERPSEDKIGCCCTGNDLISFRLPKSDYPTKESVQAWLSTNKPLFVYKTSTQESFSATPHPIFALPGTNTLYTDGNSVTVTGKQDLAFTLRQIQEQLAAVSGVMEALTGTD